MKSAPPYWRADHPFCRARFRLREQTLPDGIDRSDVEGGCRKMTGTIHDSTGPPSTGGKA
jgi:hypothetical protein